MSPTRPGLTVTDRREGRSDIQAVRPERAEALQPQVSAQRGEVRLNFKF